MKTIKLSFGLALIITLGSCGSTNLTGPGVYYDDIYYVPGSSRENVHQAFSPVPSLTGEERKNERRELAIQQSEYERSQRSREQEDLRDFSGVQQEYAAILSDENIQETDTLLYYDDETGYWVDGFQGSSMDRSYAERIIRFHGPAIRIPYHSPFYSEVVYYNHYDWNVYVDGHYAYAVPTWTNRWYNSYHFGGWYGRPYSYGMSWHFGSPYYGYGWNSWHSPWYAGHYGYWHRPYYWGGYHSHYYNSYYAHNNYYNHRPTNTRPVVYQGFRGGISGDSRSATTSRSEGLRSTRDGVSRTSTDGRVARTSSNDMLERSSRVTGRTSGGTIARGTGGDELKSTRESSSTSRRSTTDNAVRRSYTPSYSQPEGNTRPTYNRTTYTRVNNNNNTRQVQTTGTVQGASGNTRQVQPAGTNRQVQSSGTNRQVQSGAATQQPARNIQSAPARPNVQNTGTRSTGTTTRQSTPATYQRGSSSAPQRSSGVQSSPPRTSTPTRSVAPTSAPSRSVSTPTRSSSPSTPAVSSGSSGSSSRGSSGTSSGGGSSRGGRR